MQSEAVSRDTVSVGFGERFVAWLIDAIILGIAGAIIGAIFGQAAASLIGILLGVAYVTYFWTTSGQTPGKMAMGLKVVKADTGDLLDTGTAIIRYVGYIVSGIPVLLGFFWVLWDPKHDAWHDKIAGTKVIKVAR